MIKLAVVLELVSLLLTMPSPYGRICLSFEHSDEVIEQRKAAFDKAVKQLRAQFAQG